MTTALLYNLRSHFWSIIFIYSMFQTMFCRLLLKVFSGGHILPSQWKAEMLPGDATGYLVVERHEKVDRISPTHLFISNMKQSL